MNLAALLLGIVGSMMFLRSGENVFQCIFFPKECFLYAVEVEGQHSPFIIIEVDTCITFDESSKVESMDPSVPLLVFTSYAGHEEHLSIKMNFDIGSLQLRLIYCVEVLLCLQPNVITVCNSFPLGEELLFYSQNLLSEKI